MTMMNHNVIFARTRQHYVPYDDVYRLAELSGYRVQYLNEINWRDTSLTVICPVKHPEWNDVIPYGPHARIIWWNLERAVSTASIMDMSNPSVPYYVDEVWASDRAYANAIGAKYVFLGGHRAFGSVDVLDKRYDVITLMYYSGRRQRIGSDLQGFSVADTPGGLWGDERHQRLMQSRLMLSAHQDDKPYSEPIRFMIAGCYALPLLSEFCEDAGYWRENVNYAACRFEELASTANIFLAPKTYSLVTRLAAAAWRLVCVERPFAQEVEAAL